VSYTAKRGGGARIVQPLLKTDRTSARPDSLAVHILVRHPDGSLSRAAMPMRGLAELRRLPGRDDSNDLPVVEDPHPLNGNAP